MSWLLVFIGGGIGSLFRFGTGKLVSQFLPGLRFPLATLISNFISCLIFAGVMLYILPKVKDDYSFRVLLITGICGGFSTFSAFSFETFELFRQQQYLIAGINILANLLLCLFVFWLMLKNS